MTRIQRILIAVLAVVALLLTAMVVQATDLHIDIQPGDETGAIDPFSRGIIPVAILGSDTFDVEDVDVDTLAFGPHPRAGAGGPQARPAHGVGGHLEDVDGDGLTDLVSHYRTEDADLDFDEEEACVLGATLDRTAFLACDRIIIITAPPPACGIGFELAFLLPPLMWLRQRRRRITAQ